MVCGIDLSLELRQALIDRIEDAGGGAEPIDHVVMVGDSEIETECRGLLPGIHDEAEPAAAHECHGVEIDDDVVLGDAYRCCQPGCPLALAGEVQLAITTHHDGTVLFNDGHWEALIGLDHVAPRSYSTDIARVEHDKSPLR